MAHSIEIYKKKTAVINDLDLLVIIGFAVEIIHQNEEFVEFESLVMDWRQSVIQYGPGVIDLKLEHFITAPDELRKFQALLSVILRRASEYGSRISARVLNELVPAPGVRFSDYKLSYLEEAIKKIQDLVANN